MHELDGARLKVVRAQEHLDSFKRELGQYTDTQPYRFTIDRKRTSVTVTPMLTAEPPLRLSLLIGDCVSNLQAALDYVAWQLALKFWKTKPVAGSKSDKVYFFSADSLARDGMDPAALTLVRGMHTKVAGNEYLGTLSDLVNEDKHRLPLLTFGLPYGTKITVTAGTLGGGCEGAFQSITVSHWSIDDSYVIPDDVQVHGQGAVFVTLKNVVVPKEPIDRTLEQIVKCVADVIPRFEPFFT